MKKKIIALIFLLLFGIGALLFGIFGKPQYTDMMSLTDADLGKTITVQITEPLPIDDRKWILGFEDEEQPLEIRVQLNDVLHRSIRNRYRNDTDVKKGCIDCRRYSAVCCVGSSDLDTVQNEPWKISADLSACACDSGNHYWLALFQ